MAREADIHCMVHVAANHNKDQHVHKSPRDSMVMYHD